MCIRDRDNTQLNVAPGMNMMKIPDGMKHKVADISPGTTYGVGVDTDGNVYTWGYTKITETIDLKEQQNLTYMFITHDLSVVKYIDVYKRQVHGHGLQVRSWRRRDLPGLLPEVHRPLECAAA